jgi:hypothetical protein
MKKALVAVGLMALFASLVSAQNLSDAHRAGIEKAVKEQVVALCRTFDAVDPEGSLRMWSREKLIGEVTAGRIDASIDSMTSRWQNGSANVVRRQNDIQEVKVYPFSPDVAFVTCTNRLRVEQKSGNVTNYNWVGSFVWVRESGSWKVAFMAQSVSTVK